MSDMKVAVWLRWKPGLDMVIYSFRKIFIDFLLDKVFGNYFFCFLSRCHILSHINSSISFFNNMPVHLSSIILTPAIFQQDQISNCYI